MDFVAKLQETLDNEYNVSVTENMALGFRTTGKALLDLNFAVSSLRSKPESAIISKFMKAYRASGKDALVWLFFARDARGGLGERRLFRVVWSRLAKDGEIDVAPLVPLIPEYGRFDDLLVLLDSQHKGMALSLIANRLGADQEGMAKGEPISLLAKWLPSVNASSKKIRGFARTIAKALGMTWEAYRKELAKLRKYLDVVERKMSRGEFGEINYEAVPSKANIKYYKAFLNRDNERRLAFLESLKKDGGAKIKASVLYPHDIVHSYTSRGHFVNEHDETLEALWEALPSAPEIKNTIVVADGSASMAAPIGNTSCTALCVANALAIYFAGFCSGTFKDKYITFSKNPRLVDLSTGRSLRAKLEIALGHNEVANTDVYKVFELILATAQGNKMSQEELPKNIIIISDMEFDMCAENANKKLFAAIAEEYEACGYRLPRLVFWNVNSRTGTIPLKENGLGVALVSGFSVAIAKMVMSLELDPYKALMETLNSPRYDAVREALST